MIALLSVGLVFGVWYVSPLDKALGVTHIFLLLLCVDVVVGPLLTLVVAKQGKKTLKADLFTIGVVQLLALTYGLYVVSQGRPVWMVYDSGRFELVQAFEAVPNGAEGGKDKNVFSLPLTAPFWMAVKETTPWQERKEAYFKAAYLQPFDASVAVNVASRGLSLDLLRKINGAEKVDAILKQYPNANAYIPMVANQQSMVVLIAKEVGEPIAIVNLAPWYN
jgi:hypothetical protein